MDPPALGLIPGIDAEEAALGGEECAARAASSCFTFAWSLAICCAAVVSGAGEGAATVVAATIKKPAAKLHMPRDSDVITEEVFFILVFRIIEGAKAGDSSAG